LPIFVRPARVERLAGIANIPPQLMTLFGGHLAPLFPLLPALIATFTLSIAVPIILPLAVPIILPLAVPLFAPLFAPLFELTRRRRR